MIHKFAAVLFLFAGLAFSQARLLRHPTYSKGKVAFSYLGDIWIANENGSGAQRLTDHKARDIYPRFSPGGEWIAFSSNRAGNHDVYVVAAEGGKPRQLTFNSADDNVVGWTPDGKNIIFTSARSAGVFPGTATLFTVPADGGMEQAVPTDWGSNASYSPDGKKMAFTRHPGVWSRKHYRGSYAVDLWLRDVAANNFTRLGDADYKGNYFWPMYGAKGEIYFVADRLANEKNVVYGGPEVMKSVNNIWKISERGGAPVQVTKHTSGNLHFPSISADRKTIVYEENFGLWKLDVDSGRTAEIRIDVKSDLKDNELELRTFVSEAESFHLSPSGRRAAITAHGEVFTIATDRGEVQRVTETPWREQSPRWSPNGKWIAFISDRGGREEIWIAGERGQNAKQLTTEDCDKGSFLWSADSKSLLWTGSDNKLRLLDVDSGKAQIITESNVGTIGTPQFSPDGKWISYSKMDATSRSHVYVKPLAGGAEQRIEGEGFLMSSGAKWTPDGRKLLMIGGVGLPAMASLNRTTSQLYAVSLTPVDKNPDDRDVDSEEQAAAAGEAGAGRRGGPPGAAAAPAKVEVKIEWDGIARRVRQITRSSDSVMSVSPSPDSRTYAFVAFGGAGEGGAGLGGPGIFTIAEDGSRMTRVNQPVAAEADAGGRRGRGGFGFGGGGSEPQWSRDGRTLYYLQGGGIYAASISDAGPAAAPAAAAPAGFGRGGRGGGGAATAAATSASAGPAPRRISFTVRLEVDAEAERRQVFEEAWRVMKFRFYDPKMHGVNWNAMKDVYQPLLGNIRDTEELQAVLMQMIGELNASHTGVSGGGDPSERIVTRYPGFDLQSDTSGFYKVGHIYKRGPADHDYVKLAAGNYLLAVNGKELKTSENYWKLFNLLPGRKLEFTVNSKPQMEGSWTVSLEPVSGAAQRDFEYARWVDSRQEMVRKLSAGQIGYLHIRAMDAPSLTKFERDLIENQDKKALIIDQRFNGGGGIDQELLRILNQKKYQVTRRRDSIDVARPVQAYLNPMVVLQNERSASDAEMFPDGFRALGLGKLIGMPTYGAVIGTGSYRLLDGSSIRTPGVGVYTASGQNMENYGVPPDVTVDNTPADFLAGRDKQIEKAIEVLKSQMGTRADRD
ncbi:MAG: PD40 domain-containing protein [Candidatus Solibacter usitatus]|nr:PD40 domain-containing protein [Candidatus Solibacter usitatus]